MARIIVFPLQKGGVGKTSTVQNVGAGLARRGKRVLLVDLDPQANLTEGFGLDPEEMDLTIYDLMIKSRGAEYAGIVRKIKDNLWILPANIELAGAEIALPALPGKDLKLKNILKAVEADFDYILIDNPPSLGQLALNGLTAAHEIMIPLQAQYYSYKALKNLLNTIEAVKESTNPDVRVTGIILTFFRESRVLNKSVAALIQENFGGVVFKTKINENIKLAEAPTAGKDIYDYYPNCQGAWDYKNLCEEIMAMEKNNE